MKNFLVLASVLLPMLASAQNHDPRDRSDRRDAQEDRNDRDRDRHRDERRDDRGRPGPNRPPQDYGRRRNDHWSDRNYRMRARELVQRYALLGENFKTRILGYTLLSDAGQEFDKVDVFDRYGYEAIKIKVLGDSARIDNVTVKFCDPQNLWDKRQSFSPRVTLRERESTPWMRLSGISRCIDNFSVVGVGNRRDSDDTIVVILGIGERR